MDLVIALLELIVWQDGRRFFFPWLPERRATPACHGNVALARARIFALRAGQFARANLRGRSAGGSQGERFTNFSRLA